MEANNREASQGTNQGGPWQEAPLKRKGPSLIQLGPFRGGVRPRAERLQVMS